MKYIGYYDHEIGNRSMSLAATNKMNYIAEVLAKYDDKVTIVACGVSGKRKEKAHDIQVLDNVKVHYLDTMKQPTSVFARVFHRIKRFLSISNYLLRECRVGETVLVYHSLGIMKVIRFVKKVKKLNLILEVEEVYNDVRRQKKEYSIDKELSFFQIADGYIFPTELLNEKINTSNKPFAIIQGTYKVEFQRICKKEYRKIHGWDDSKVHVVYAGTLDPRKGGAVAAAAAAEFLPNNYHIHILGFGDDSEIWKMKDIVDELASRSAANVTYDGLLSGEEYIQFLQSCDVGLSTQNPDAAFNETSFPSKILSYMANGLMVVSIRIPAVELSSVGDMVTYYSEQTPMCIADAICKIDISQLEDGRNRIAHLDEVFRMDLLKLMGQIIGAGGRKDEM